MPKLIRLYITQVLLGFGLALAFVALLLALDVAGLRHLVLGTPMGWLGGVMLLVFNGLVFAGVQFGISIMRMAEDEDGAPPGGRRSRRPRTPAQRFDGPLGQPVPVPARSPSRRPPAPARDR